MQVLLIEDDPSVRRIVGLALEHAGFMVVSEATGRDGIAQAVRGDFDVIVLDLNLPDMDGMDVCRAIRAASATRILMLTARDSIDSRVAGLEAGADDYLVKPFAPRELVARARALVRRPGPMRSPDQPLELGSWRIFPRSRQVTVQGRAIDLTRREFDLLLYLADNRNLTVTRDMVLERVWGWGYGGGSNVVDVYIGYLRQKLNGDVDAGDDDPRIVTVRGVGYRLAVTETKTPEHV
ncbi:MAG: response regulator transcription factor [Clostridia bacterium]